MQYRRGTVKSGSTQPAALMTGGPQIVFDCCLGMKSEEQLIALIYTLHFPRLQFQNFKRLVYPGARELGPD